MSNPLMCQKSAASKTAVFSRRRSNVGLAAACSLALAGFARVATAADDGTLTWNGVTLYGVVDIGVAYQNHGVPASQDLYTGMYYLVLKGSNKPVTSISESGLSQSRVGLKGTEKIADDLDFVFNLETGFNPISGRLADAPQSLIDNNGRALTDYKAGADGSRAGQLFNGPAFGGLSSPVFGMLTVGRHNTLLTDTVGKYDPNGGSYAFSLIGFSGVAAGGGNTENVRADDSVKYNYKHDNFHFAAFWQFGKNDGSPGDGGQFDVGADFGGFSVDALYAFKKDSISAGSLSAAQITSGLPHDSLAATISDNESWMLAGSYKFSDALKVYGGYEHITYENPSNPLAAGFDGLGGYFISVTNNNAYPFDRKLQVSWLGAKYQATKDLSLTGAWYHYDQGDYHSVVPKGATEAERAPCSNASAASCSGTEDVLSFVADYRFTKRFDVYAGLAYSKVNDGLASGFVLTLAPGGSISIKSSASVLNTMVGFRFQF